MAADVTHFLEQIPQYLDESLSDDERMAFEAAAERHDVLRDTLAQHRSVDAALKRRFEPPSAQALMQWTSKLDGADTTPASDASSFPIVDAERSLMMRLRPVLAIAASLVLTIAGVWLVVSSTGMLDSDDDNGPYGPQQSVAQAYASAVETGFEPDWVCRDDAEFASTFEKQYRQPLAFDPSDGVQLLGLSYANIFSGRTTGVLARVNEQPVVVFVDHHTQFGNHVEPGEAMDAFLASTLPSDSELRIFHKRLGELMLIEVTPNAESTILDAFRVAERPEMPQSGEEK